MKKENQALPERIAELEALLVALQQEAKKPLRRRLSDTRLAVVHKFVVGGTHGYFRIGLFEDGQPGEVFVNINKSQDAGPWGCIGILMSMALQRGTPLSDLVRKLGRTNFGASGVTKNPKLPMATSIMDYLVRWMEMEFGTK